MSDTFHADIKSAIRQTLLAATIGIIAPGQFAMAGRDFSSTIGVPYMRESYKGGPEALKTIPAKRGLVRLDGVYLLDLFFPDASGMGKTELAVGAIRRAFAPGTTIAYNGQVVTCLSVPRAGERTDQGFIQTPLTIRFYAYDVNP